MPAGEFFGTTTAARSVCGLRFFEKTYDSGDSPVHGHEHAALCLVLEGQFTEHHSAGKFVCAPQSVLFYPAGFSHHEAFDAPSSRCFVAEIPQSWIEELREGSPLAPHPIQARGGALAEIALRMCCETRSLDSASPLVLEGLMLEFLGTAARQKAAKHSRQAGRLERFREALHGHFRESLSLGRLARMTGLTPVIVARRFRLHYGCTVGSYVRRLRVEFAARLLAETDTPLSEVALSAGFCDQSHLCRVFRRFVGTSPGDFRRSAGRSQTE